MEIRLSVAEDWRHKREQNQSDNKKVWGKRKGVPKEEIDWYVKAKLILLLKRMYH